jgi:hypothetical protein
MSMPPFGVLRTRALFSIGLTALAVFSAACSSTARTFDAEPRGSLLGSSGSTTAVPKAGVAGLGQLPARSVRQLLVIFKRQNGIV